MMRSLAALVAVCAHCRGIIIAALVLPLWARPHISTVFGPEYCCLQPDKQYQLVDRFDISEYNHSCPFFICFALDQIFWLVHPYAAVL